MEILIFELIYTYPQLTERKKDVPLSYIPIKIDKKVREVAITAASPRKHKTINKKLLSE